jgi:hypothetical protein
MDLRKLFKLLGRRITNLSESYARLGVVHLLSRFLQCGAELQCQCKNGIECRLWYKVN